MRTRSTTFAGLALSAALMLSACASPQPEDSTAADARSASASQGSEGTTTAPAPASSGASASGSGAAQGSGPAADGPVDADHNEADTAFVQMMIPHHEQAVDIGTLLEDKADVPQDVAALAARIKDEQAPEVDRMKEMLDAWGEDASAKGHDGHKGMAGHPGMEMDGMLSDTQMRQIETADGPTAAHLYVSHMIGHHRGAIAMAEAELRDGQNPQALALATAIIEAQEAEVQELMQLPQAK